METKKKFQTKFQKFLVSNFFFFQKKFFNFFFQNLFLEYFLRIFSEHFKSLARKMPALLYKRGSQGQNLKNVNGWPFFLGWLRTLIFFSKWFYSQKEKVPSLSSWIFGSEHIFVKLSQFFFLQNMQGGGQKNIFLHLIIQCH